MKPEVQRLFEAALDLPEEQQAEYIAAQSSGPAVSNEVLSLLAHDRLAQPFFDAVLGSAAASMELTLDLRAGARLGAYIIERTLGRGGMGTVYLASRADGAFEHKVAIKVIRPSSSLPFLSERFRQERQILARLNHPNIARLLDGGESEAGLLYFVLEYVAGEDVQQYCDRQQLDLRTRLQLFRQVIGAVHNAHENLIVHRDLKPGNILVAQDGTPKLLDFGVAKVMEPFETAGPSTRMFTMEYASPEQIRGEPITTAADIYSLGAVLHQLLTARPLRSFQNLSPLEAVRAISDEEPPIAPGLPREVEAILRKALHTEPSRRYRSAYDFGSDIERYLGGQPVLAVPDSLLYRFRTFFRRNWIPATAGTAVALALGVGAGVALWQARRAERRFADVRQLSNQFLFEFEESIHNVPGATKARALVVKTAQQYLDRLSGEAGQDRDLTRELAEAYRKLGDVQGSTLEGNIGDNQAALISYRKALALRDSIDDEHALDTKTRASYLDALKGLANAEVASGDASRALPLNEKAVKVAKSWIGNGSDDPELLSVAATCYAQLATRQMEKADFAGAIESAQRSLGLKKNALDLRPSDVKLQRAVATGYWSVGSAEKSAGHPEQAVANFQITVNLLRQLSARDPANVSGRRELLGATWLLAASTQNVFQKLKKDESAALPLFDEAWRMGTQLLKEDPDNALVEADVASISLGLGVTLQESGRAADALKVIAPAIERQKRRVNASPGNRTAAYFLALFYMTSASCRTDLHDLPAALRDRRIAEDILDRLVHDNPGLFDYRFDKASNLAETGTVLVAVGDYAGARARYREALRSAEALPQGPALQDTSALIASLHAATERIAQK